MHPSVSVSVSVSSRNNIVKYFISITFRLHRHFCLYPSMYTHFRCSGTPVLSCWLVNKQAVTHKLHSLHESIAINRHVVCRQLCSYDAPITALRTEVTEQRLMTRIFRRQSDERVIIVCGCTAGWLLGWTGGRMLSWWAIRFVVMMMVRVMMVRHVMTATGWWRFHGFRCWRQYQIAIWNRGAHNTCPRISTHKVIPFETK